MPSAERAIENFIARYAFLVDDGDFAGLGELLDHAAFRLGEAVAHGQADVEKLAHAVLQTYADGTREVSTDLVGDVSHHVKAAGQDDRLP